VGPYSSISFSPTSQTVNAGEEALYSFHIEEGPEICVPPDNVPWQWPVFTGLGSGMAVDFGGSGGGFYSVNSTYDGGLAIYTSTDTPTGTYQITINWNEYQGPEPTVSSHAYYGGTPGSADTFYITQYTSTIQLTVVGASETGGTSVSTSGGDTTFYIFVIIVAVIFGAYIWNKQRRNTPVQQIQTQVPSRQTTTGVQERFHGHWEDNAGRYVPFKPVPPTSGAPDPLGPYRWVSPEEEQQRADAMKKSDEWFKQHPPEHRTPPQPPPPRPTVTFGRHSCPNCGEPGQSGRFCTKCGTKF